jgi:hypothetical protein
MLWKDAFSQVQNVQSFIDVKKIKMLIAELLTLEPGHFQDTVNVLKGIYRLVLIYFRKDCLKQEVKITFRDSYTHKFV